MKICHSIANMSKMNARTCHNEPDFLLNNDFVFCFPKNIYGTQIKNRMPYQPGQFNDARRRNLLDFCVESQFGILNDWTFSDTRGMFTSYKCNGKSVVDCTIASGRLLPQVLSLGVSLNQPRLSDHSKISCTIMDNYSRHCN